MDDVNENNKIEREMVRRYLMSALLRTAAAAAVLGLTLTFLFGVATVESNDMFPQIQAGDLLVFFRPGSIGKQDAVIYESPEGTAAGRIAGCPGDTVDVTDSGQLTINGNLQPVQKRLGIYEETEINDEGNAYPADLGGDEYYILGDSREDARDSRKYGCIGKKDIKGVIFLLIRRRAV